MILYIHGYGSSGASNTVAVLRQLLNGKRTVIAPDFPVDPADAIPLAEDQLRKYPIRLVIASSYGAFFLANMAVDVPRIYINPCLYPSREISKTGGHFTEEQESRCRQMEKELPTILSQHNKATSYGIFSTRDELFSYKNEFEPYLGHVLIVNDLHRLSDETFRHVLLPIAEQILK